MGKLNLNALQPDQAAVPTQQTPGYRGAVTAAETKARGQFKDELRTTADGREVLGQVNTVTGEFKPYAKEFQPQTKMKLTPQELADARADAIRRAAIAQNLLTSSKNDWFSTGFLAPSLSSYGGTAAYTNKMNIEALKAGGALNVLLDMAKKTGKNLLTPLSNSDVQLLSNAKNLPLDVGMADKDFQANAQQYFNANKRAFMAAGGSAKQFDNELSKYSATSSKNSDVDAILAKHGVK